MATPVKRGTDEPLLQKQTYSQSWSAGWNYGEEWKGISPDKMLAKYNGLKYTVQSAKMTVTKGVADLTLEWATSPSGNYGSRDSIEITQDRWECPEPRIEKDILNHPQFLAIWNATGVTYSQLISTISLIRRYAESGKSAGQSIIKEADMLNALSSYFSTISATMPTGDSLEKALRFYRLYINDQTHYQASAFSCRHTCNAPNYWSLNRADVGVNCVYSPARFMSEVTDGSLWYFPLPGRLQYKFAAAASALNSANPTRANFLNGWLKSASSESTAAKGRIEIQTGYVLDQWSTDLYPALT